MKILIDFILLVSIFLFVNSKQYDVMQRIKFGDKNSLRIKDKIDGYFRMRNLFKQYGMGQSSSQNHELQKHQNDMQLSETSAYTAGYVVFTNYISSACSSGTSADIQYVRLGLCVPFDYNFTNYNVTIISYAKYSLSISATTVSGYADVFASSRCSGASTRITVVSGSATCIPADASTGSYESMTITFADAIPADSKFRRGLLEK